MSRSSTTSGKPVFGYVMSLGVDQEVTGHKVTRVLSLEVEGSRGKVGPIESDLGD